MQTHLKGFGLENFRVFKDYTWFDFAPITILTGPNSSGKSSLNKALLLLKDNFEKGNLPPYYTLTHEGWSTTNELLWGRDSPPSKDEGEYHAEYEASTLRFDGKIHELGNLTSTKCRSSDSNIIGFSIPYKININRSFIWNEVECIFNEPSSINEDYIINLIKNGYTDSEKTKNDLLKNIENSKSILGKFKVLGQLNSLGERTILCHYTFQADKNAKSLFQLELQNDKGVTFLKIGEKSIFFNLELYDSLIANSEHKLLNKFSSYKEHIYANHQIDLIYWFIENGINKKIAKQYAYRVLEILGVSLYNHKASVKYEISLIENIFIKLDILSTNKFSQKKAYGEDDNSNYKSTLISLNESKNNGSNFEGFFNRSSQLFGLQNKLNFKYNEEQDSFFPSIDGHSLKSFGYGLSIISNLIFKIAEIGNNKYESGPDGDRHPTGETSLLMLEEPEANLHPKFQSLLADFLVEAANEFNIQFIIETHSEYLIRKLQFLTAKKTIQPKDSIIYYFHEPNNIPVGEKQVKKIEILEDGSLSSDFGPGFFDEATNWKFELLRLKNSQNN